MTRSSTPPLSVAAVTAGGRDIVAEEGFHALTMRRIADRLAVWQTAIDHYVNDCDHLAEMVADAVVTTAALPTDPDPAGWLPTAAWEVRRIGLAHHGLAAYPLKREPSGPAGLRLADATGQRMAARGWSGPDLAQAYNWFFTWLAGSIPKTDGFLQAGGREGLDQFDRTIDAVGPHQMPHLSTMRRTFHAIPDDLDSVFVRGLDRTMGLLEAGP